MNTPTTPVLCCTTCQTCKPFPGGHLCINCWEVQHRLEDYLASNSGRKFMREALAKAVQKAHADLNKEKTT